VIGPRVPIESASVTLGALTVLNILNYADRYVGAAVLPLMLADLSLTDAQGGVLQSVFVLSYSLMSPLTGWLGDRYRRLALAAAGVAVWSVATVGSGLAPSYGILLLARAITGVGEASYAVVTPSLIADLYPAERRGRALAVFYAAIPVGTALGYVAGGAVGAAWNWRAAFLMAGLPGAVLALMLPALREPRRGAFDAPSARGIGLALGPSLAALAARPSYTFNTVAQIGYTFVLGGLAAWMPTYFVRERALTLATATTTFGAVLLLAGFGGTLLGGVLGDRLARRWPAGHFLVSGAGLVISTVFTAVAVLSPDPRVYWPAMFLALVLVFLNIGPLNAAMANVLPPDLRARGFAVSTMAIHLLGDAASPWLIGVVSDALGLKTPVLVSGLLLGASGLVLLGGMRSLERDLNAGRPPEASS
jgi:MFS transporter, Spinster family, sphingosine-1-phosphate transporter